MFKLKFKVQGAFQIKKIKKNGDIEQTPWFNNVVLDQGLDAMATTGWSNGVAVGTSNTTPIPTQTSLVSEIARTTTLQGVQSRDAYQLDEATWVHSIIKTYRFPLGVAAGNLSEVGILCGQGGNVKLWNRALIRDINGNPTTITVLPDEILDITFEIKAYVSTADSSGSFNLLDKNGMLISTINYTARPANINQPHNVGVGMNVMNAQSFNYAEGYTLASLTGATGIINGNPVGTFRNTSGNFAIAVYNTGSHKLKFTINAEVDKMNVATGLSGLFVQGVLSSFQIVFDQPIVKNNTQTFSLDYEISWGRYEPA